MPKLQTIQTNLTGGEVSPKLFGRVDLQRYQNGAEAIENAHSLVYGGAARRNGTRFVVETKTSAKRSRLIPYVVDRAVAYQLELGDLYLRVYAGDTLALQTELASPYTEAMLDDIDFVQGSDEMLFAHPDVPIQRLRRFAATLWELAAAPFTTTPFDEVGYSSSATLTLSAASVGAGRTVTASAATFVSADVGRAILMDAGIAVITAVATPSSATVQINRAFGSTALPGYTWLIDSSPMTTLTPSAKGPVGATINVQLATDGFRATEVGQFIRVNDGLVKLLAMAYDHADAEVITELSSTAAAPALAWTLESSVWTPQAGYPRTLTLYEQRLVTGGSRKYPQTIWGSRSGELFDFTKGTLDDESFSFTIASDEVNPITYLCAARVLIVLTEGGEFTVQGGVEKPITPTTIQIKPQSPFGAYAIRPVNVGKEIMFVQRSGRKVRSLAYQYTQDGYVAPDITVLAEHITESGIVDMAYQQEPYQLLWVVRRDGLLVSCTIDRDQDVIAWNRHPIDGFVERVSTIPGANGDDLWLVVRRTINGVARRYLERIETSWLPFANSAKDWGYLLDAAKAVTFSTPQATVTGLEHLEGRIVGVLADGFPMQPGVVSGGSVTLARTASSVLIGIPYRTRIRLLRPEVQGGTGTSQLSARRTSQVRLRFHETIGAKLDGEIVPFRTFGPLLLDQPPTPFSGDHDVTQLGWEEADERLEITQDDPTPFHLLAVMRELTINAG